MDVATAVAPLGEAGLFYRHGEVRGKTYVRGGEREFDAGGIRGWENPFVIFEEDDKFTARVAAVQAHPRDAERKGSTLEEAVAFVLQVYRERRG